MNNYYKISKRVLVTTMSLSLLLQSTWALPDPRADISQATSKINLKGIGVVLGDHEKPNVLYVKPGYYKFKGKFQQTAGIVDCDDLHNLRKNVHRMPTVEEFPEVIKRSDFFSPLFESTVGVAAKNISLLKDIADAKMEAENYQLEHQEVYGAYKAAEAKLLLHKTEIDTLNAQIESLQASFVSKLALTKNDIERNQLRNDFKNELLDLNNKKTVYAAQKSNAAQEYFITLKSWAPFKDRLSWLESIEDSLELSFNKMQQIADDSLDRSKRALNVLNEKIIGFASTGYSLSPDQKIEKLNEQLRKAGLTSYNVSPVIPFNIRLNPGVTKSNLSVKNSTDNVDYQLQTYHFPNTTSHQIGDNERIITIPGVKVDTGGKQEEYRYSVADFGESFGSSQSFEMPITQGGFCGYGKSKKVHYHQIDEKGNKISKTVEFMSYESPTKNQPLFVQNIALRYNYYQKAEPIKGRCSMDIQKSTSYIRNKGRKTKWRWFKKTSKTWDHTKVQMLNNLGLKCELTQSPQGANPEEALMRNKAFEKALYKDMFGMFITTYAKEYEAKPVKPDLIGKESKIFKEIGTGIINLCGPNIYCQVSGIVLKTIDELVGSKHTGVSSHTTSLSGKLTKEMTLDSYMIAEGMSLMEMRVCVDHKKCDE